MRGEREMGGEERHDLYGVPLHVFSVSRYIGHAGRLRCGGGWGLVRRKQRRRDLEYSSFVLHFAWSSYEAQSTEICARFFFFFSISRFRHDGRSICTRE